MLAPHPDDEVFGCGGAIASHVRMGIPVGVVILTDGALFGNASIRTGECLAAANVLGYGQPDFWRLPDRGLRYSEELVQRIVDRIEASGIDLVYAPSPWEVHPDHRQTALLALEAVRRVGQPVRLAFYEVGVPLRPNVLLDITASLDAKQDAMRCFESQLAQQDYVQQIQALNQYRTYTLPRDVRAAEAFWVLAASEIDQMTTFGFFMHVSPGVLSASPQNTPLVSILIRSRDRECLAEALDSVALQVYPNIEVVLVAVRPDHRPVPKNCGPFSVRLYQTDTPLTYSQAANKAMEQARGDYFLFLNDDDWLMPGHIARLAHVLARQPHVLAAYTGISLLDEVGHPLGQIFDLPYDATRLMAGNLVPINAVLFNSSVLEQGCSFDETLDLNEDWDFWLQLAKLAPLVHLPGVSGAHRMHNSLGEGTDITPEGTSAELIFSKWGPHWTPQQITDVMHRAWLYPALQEQLTDTERRLALSEGVVAQNQHVMAQQQKQIEFTHNQCAQMEMRAAQQANVISQQQQQQQQQIEDFIKSRSWRVTAPLRRTIHLLSILSRWAQKNWLDRGTLQELGRAFYMRSKTLRMMREKYVHWKRRAVSKIEVLSNSSDNLPALRALSSRRFDRLALMSAVAAVDPVIWPEIDVSVVSYNSARWVESFIKSLCSLRYPLAKMHLRFVDHGSKDDTVSKLEGLLATVGMRFASVRIIQQENLGFGHGHHRAISDGQSEYCLVTNLDLEFDPDSLCNVVRVALNDTTGIVASWELRQIPFEHPKYYDPVTWETNWSSHACILMRRSAYRRVGGYDTGIFMYAEDVELSYRFRSYGYVLKYVPTAFVNHFTYESAGQVKPLQFSGSAVGNIYIRFRYGKNLDRFLGILLYIARFFRPSPFVGAKYLLLKNVFLLIKMAPHFLMGKGAALAYFPLRGYDYEMTRDGAFREVLPPPSVDNLPLVTVITRTYKGRGAFLEQAMQSVFNQTYQAIELLVVEDGGDSQQALVTLLTERAPSGCHVRFIANEKLGRSAAGNAALASSTGSFLMFLDDDDLLFSDHIEILVAALLGDRTLSAAYALAMEVQTRVDSSMASYSEDSFHTPHSFRQEWDYSVLLDHNFIPIQAILFKRELYEKRGGFDTELDQLEDWNLWLRYGYGNQFLYVEKTTSVFRSPAETEIRSARHALLHVAYNDAKNRALKSIEKWEAVR